MITEAERNKATIEALASALVADAKRLHVTVTIELKHHHPPVGGQYDMVPVVWADHRRQ